MLRKKILTTVVRAKMIGRLYADMTIQVVMKMQTSISALLASTASANRLEIMFGMGEMK